MLYAGNPDLSAEAQERVTTAFRQVVAKLQANQRQEALIGLEFVLRLDPSFRPAQNLQQQLASGSSEIDLSAVVDQLHAPSEEEIALLLVDAVEDFNRRRFLEAKQKTEKVLADLPGHDEARQLLRQVEDALKVEAQVGQFLARAREALDQNDPQEAANFVLMAQTLDPHNPGIAATLEEIHAVEPSVSTARPKAGKAPADLGAEPPVGPDEGLFSADEPGGDAAAVSFDEAPAAPDLAFDEEESEPAYAAEGGTVEGGSPPAAPGIDWGEEEAPADVGSFSFPHEADAAGAGAAGAGEAADIADLFDAEGAEEGPEAEAGEGEDSERITQLLQQGQEAFDRGDFQGAIDIWSRIFLIDPSHGETGRRIDLARQRKDEVDRRVENLLYEAQDAADAGNTAVALERLEQVLAETPNHLVALELKERLTGAEAAPSDTPPLPELPDLEDDLFEDAGAGGVAELQADETELAGGLEAVPVDDIELVIPDQARVRPVAAPRPGAFPWRVVVAGVVGVLVLSLGVWFGSRLLSPEAGEDEHAALERALAQADELFQAGRVEEAIHLLQEFPASGLVQSRIARRLSRYQQALAPPSPTPIPAELTAAEDAFSSGRWLLAYRSASAGLEGRPHDTGLLDLRARIIDQEPLVAALDRALQSEEYATAASIAEDLASRYTEDPDFRTELERSLFNAGLLELRTHNLAGAEVFLTNLARRRPDDDEVRRILEFISEYKTRPVDMQLRVFIGSLSTR